MGKKARKARKYTSSRVPSEKERAEAVEAGSRFLTEKEKDEIEKDMESGESEARKVSDREVAERKKKK